MSYFTAQLPTPPPAPPKYELETDYVEAAVGESPIVNFTITSHPPLGEDAKHTLTCEDGRPATKRFKVQGDCVTFRNIRVGDSGVYTISCQNEAGLIGKETLELDITSSIPAPTGGLKSGKSLDICL